MLNPDMPAQELRLHMGELTADEMRVARAAVRWANTRAAALERFASEVRDIIETPMGPEVIDDVYAHADQLVHRVNRIYDALSRLEGASDE